MTYHDGYFGVTDKGRRYCSIRRRPDFVRARDVIFAVPADVTLDGDRATYRGITLSLSQWVRRGLIKMMEESRE